MSFRSLYNEVQTITGKISTNWIRQRAVDLSRITDIREMWSGVLNPKNVRGFYIEGPMGPPVPRAENESLIVLSNSMCTGAQGKYWRRFIKTKEMMHVFDTDDELTDSAEKFDDLIEKFKDPDAAPSLQFRAEVKALWRAHGVLCQENRRQEFKRQIENSETSVDIVSGALQIPPSTVRTLMRDDFLDRINGVMD